MNSLHVTTIQADLHWEDIPANLSSFEEKLTRIGTATDLIILPEMFTTGFSMNVTTLAEKPGGRTMEWMKRHAFLYQSVIMGSLIITENGSYYNRLIAMFPDGKYYQYDKRHLFSLAGEHQVYQGGNERLLFQIKNWWICPLICYDLRFHVWSRNLGPYYDILIYIANFPTARINAWDTLLQGRAIENQAFTIGVNRVGTDGKNIPYCGHTRVLDYAGETLYTVSDKEDIHTTILDKKALRDFRNRFNFLDDQDYFEIVR